MGKISIEELDNNLKEIIHQGGGNSGGSNKASEIYLEDLNGLFESENVEDALKESKEELSTLKNRFEFLLTTGNLKQIVNGNLNDPLENGFYNFTNPLAGRPSTYTGECDFLLEVSSILSPHNSNWQRYILYDVRSKAMFTRVKTNGELSTWSEIITDESFLKHAKSYTMVRYGLNGVDPNDTAITRGEVFTCTYSGNSFGTPYNWTTLININGYGHFTTQIAIDGAPSGSHKMSVRNEYPGIGWSAWTEIGNKFTVSSQAPSGGNNGDIWFII